MVKKIRTISGILTVILWLILGCYLDNGAGADRQEPDSLLTSRAAPPTKYKITYFWVYSPEDEPVDMNTRLVDMLDFNNQVIATIPQAVAERIAMEGSGFLPSDPQYVEPDSKAGALLNLVNDAGWPGSRFIELDKTKYPWGMSGMGEALVPFWTVAVDPAVFPLGTIIYVPDYEGYVLPDGFTTITGSSVHDGLFYCGDISWSFKGKQIDVFPATYPHWQETENYLSSLSRVPIYVYATPAPFLPPNLEHAIPGERIQFEDYNLGGEAIAYHDATAGNDGGVYRSDDVDIEYCSDLDAGYNVGWPAEGEWLAYNVVAPADVTVSLDLRVAAWSSAQSVHVELDGVNVTGSLVLPNTGYWQAWETIT